MKPIATVQSIRDAESAWFAAHPSGNLMRTAADAVAEVAAETLLDEPEREVVLVVAGPGNNAGDALFAAAGLEHLLGRDVPLAVWPVTGHTHPAGLTAALDAGAELVGAAEAAGLVPRAALVLDGVSGLGGHPGLAPEVAAFARACTRHGTPVVAVDIPSGLQADSGAAAADSFVATVTVTFIALKLAHVARPAADRCGRVILVDIGVEPPRTAIHAVERSDLAARYPWPGPTSDKYARGVVGLDTGSAAYPGAAVLTAAGALHAGAGIIRYAGPSAGLVLARFPSAVVPPDPARPGRVEAWVCGSGWDTPGAAERLARRAADGVPMVLDAGALDVLPGTLPPGCLLTPHAGELARLLGTTRDQVEADPLGEARAAASRTGATVLLKGATQYVAAPDGGVLVATPGLSWTATAGSGDVLAGACGALLAAGVPAIWAGALAASLQAEASFLHPGPTPPDALARVFGAVITGWHGSTSLRP